MKIFVTSNCVLMQLVRALQFLVPDASISYVGFQDLITPGVKGTVKLQMAEADLVVALDWDDFYGDFSVAKIGGWTKRHIIVPGINFAGYHPDMTYLKVNTGHNVSSPMAAYNSLIVVAGFLAGLSEERTVEMFNSLTYRRLGYFEAFEASKTDLTATFAGHGLDIAPLFADWERRGAFMHTVNHPKGFVVGDIAAVACRTNGLGRVLDTRYGDYLPDELVQGPVWPVYPELARRLNTHGSYVFKTSAASTSAPEHLMTLEDFVRGSYATYREADTSAWLVPERVQEAIRYFKTLE